MKVVKVVRVERVEKVERDGRKLGSKSLTVKKNKVNLVQNLYIHFLYLK